MKDLQLEFCDSRAFKNQARHIVYMYRGTFYGSVNREWAMFLNLSLGWVGVRRLGGSEMGVRRE